MVDRNLQANNYNFFRNYKTTKISNVQNLASINKFLPFNGHSMVQIFELRHIL